MEDNDQAKTTAKTLETFDEGQLNSPKLESLREEIGKQPTQPDNPKVTERLSIAEKERVELEGRKAYYALRSKWSNWIIGWITALIAFNCLVAVMIGFGLLSYTEHQWFITCLLYTSPSPRDKRQSRMPSSA